MQHVAYIAGASGTGTSTTAFALRRELERDAPERPCLILATDVIRAQLRTALDAAACPELWGESFNLPVIDGDRLRDGVNVDGFARQCAPILRAVEAGVDYALSEGWHVIVEGVHLLPGAYVQAASTPDRPVTVRSELLVVDDPIEHAERFRSRDRASGGQRSAAHYERNLARVHAIQAELRERWDATLGPD